MPAVELRSIQNFEEKNQHLINALYIAVINAIDDNTFIGKLLELTVALQNRLGSEIPICLLQQLKLSRYADKSSMYFY